MSDIHIHRTHQLGKEAVRAMALQWAQKAEEKYDMECSYAEGDPQDTLSFARSGVKGTLDVGSDALEFRAQLGFLFSAFKERIETELRLQLEGMLAAHHADQSVQALASTEVVEPEASLLAGGKTAKH